MPKSEQKKNRDASDFLTRVVGMTRVLTACWKNGRICDGYFVHPRWVDVDDLLRRRQTYEAEPATLSDQNRGVWNGAASHRNLHCGTPLRASPGGMR